MKKAEGLVAKDLRYIWHPYTQMKDHEDFPPIAIERAEGVKLYDIEGNSYYDTISSWWCNIHGHNHPYLKDAIKQQLDRFEHVMFAGFTHAPAVELAERLIKLSPGGIARVFYSDNGSTAVEAAMKMSFQYWYNRGMREKRSFLSLEKAYHGDTIGTMSVSGVDLFNEKFKELFLSSYRAPVPESYSRGEDNRACPGDVAGCLDRMAAILAEHHREIAAVLIEPVLLGAAGMLIYPAEYLKGVYELTRKYGVHLIADEVATGFFRTGRFFACEHGPVEPDFMCLSKGITAGYMPLGATLTTEEIFRTFYDDHDKYKTFYHGHTFTANPLSCAVGVASIDLIEKDRLQERVPVIEKRIGVFLEEISELPVVGMTRNIGVIGAFDLLKNKNSRQYFPSEDRVGYRVYRAGLKKGLVLRPLGDTIYFFLPLCVGDDDLDEIFARTREVVEEAFTGVSG